MNHLIYVRKADGTRELFEEQKLIDSLTNVGGSAEVISKIVEQVEREMKDDMSTDIIYKHAFDLLRKHSMPVAVKYSLRKALSELGPDGFPFEKFVSKIFESWGYETITDQTVYGGCVSHEVDVVAWNKSRLIMVEAKFHNELGLRSDIKIALYVKARFDDLSGNMFNYGGKVRRLDEGWLITNTKFTDQAIKYGECHKGEIPFKMIGWNYPARGNLHDIIVGQGLHPFTCLNSISSVQKKALIAKGVVLCKDIVQNTHFLNEIGMTPEDAKKSLDEIETICRL